MEASCANVHEAVSMLLLVVDVENNVTTTSLLDELQRHVLHAENLIL